MQKRMSILGILLVGCTTASTTPQAIGSNLEAGAPRGDASDRSNDATAGNANDGSPELNGDASAPDGASDAGPGVTTGDAGTDGPSGPPDGEAVGQDDSGSSADAGGTTYYVSASAGSDSNPGTVAAPWQTIQHAGGIVQAGDTVLVRAGTYDGAIFGWDDPPCQGDEYCVIAGTASSPIVLEADPGAAPGSVIIASRNSKTAMGLDLEPGCDYVNIVGFTVTNAGTAKTSAGSITKAGIGVESSTGNKVLNNTINGVSGIGGIFVDNVDGVVVQGNTVLNTQGTSTTGHGMYVSGSSTGVQVLENVIRNNAYVGIHINGDVSEGLPGVVKSITVAGNLIYSNGQNGINADGLQDSTIENNVIYANARNGIELYQIDAFGGSMSNTIVNNTIDQSMVSGSYAITIAPCAYDNQSSQPTPAGCSTASADTSTGNIAFDNVLLGAAGVDSVVATDDLALGHNITAPSASLFVNAAGGNYQLAPGGAGIGTGVATFDGATAPAASANSYDTGAFSFAP